MTKIEKKIVLFHLLRMELNYAEAMKWSSNSLVYKKYRESANAIWCLYQDIAIAGRGQIDPDMIDGRLAVCKAAVKAAMLGISSHQLSKADLEAILEDRDILIEDDAV